jgi:glutaredoxin
MKTIIIALCLFIVFLSIYLLPSSPTLKSSAGGTWTVFGTTGCSWTTKQLAEMESKGITYKFVDCDKENQACVGMSGFPTLKNDDGTVKIGFTPM